MWWKLRLPIIQAMVSYDCTSVSNVITLNVAVFSLPRRIHVLTKFLTTVHVPVQAPPYSFWHYDSVMNPARFRAVVISFLQNDRKLGCPRQAPAAQEFNVEPNPDEDVTGKLICASTSSIDWDVFLLDLAFLLSSSWRTLGANNRQSTKIRSNLGDLCSDLPLLIMWWRLETDLTSSFNCMNHSVENHHLAQSHSCSIRYLIRKDAPLQSSLRFCNTREDITDSLVRPIHEFPEIDG